MGWKTAKRKYQELNREHFDGSLPEDLPILWNTRLRTTAGQCCCESDGRTITLLRIELNPRLLTDDEKIREVLIHEMVHAWFAHVHGRNEGHSPAFQAKMDSIVGYRSSHTCHNYDTSHVREKLNVEAICPNHGVVGKRARMPREKNLNRYYCQKCGNKVRFVRNDEDEFNPFA